jgi:hypothetical protein
MRMSPTLRKCSAICGLALSALLVAVTVAASHAEERGGDATARGGPGAGADAAHPDGARPGSYDGDRHATSPPSAGPNGSAASHGGIDLVSPDGGYGNLRRRAAARRASATIVPMTAPGVPGILKMNIHAVPGSGAGHVEPGRNAVGIATAGTGEFGHHPPGVISHAPVGAPGQAGTSPSAELRAALHASHGAPNPAINGGINGTNLGRPVTTGIGGPARVQSGINGTAFRPKY